MKELIHVIKNSYTFAKRNPAKLLLLLPQTDGSLKATQVDEPDLRPVVLVLDKSIDFSRYLVDNKALLTDGVDSWGQIQHSQHFLFKAQRNEIGEFDIACCIREYSMEKKGRGVYE